MAREEEARGATQVWYGYGRAAETWKVDPFLYQILPENETHFYTRTKHFKQNLLKIVKLSSKFQKFGIRLMKLGLFSRQFSKMFIPVFALNKGSSLYQEADFATHFSGTSPDRPLYKEPTGGRGLTEEKMESQHSHLHWHNMGQESTRQRRWQLLVEGYIQQWLI